MKARILVTEDDTVAGELFAEVLEEQGYAVDRVETGEEALARLRGAGGGSSGSGSGGHAGGGTGPYDLLLVDVQLPGRSGLEVTREARRLHPDLPIVVMTAFGSMETAIEAIHEGAFDYASKPINLEELKQVVARALSQRGAAEPDEAANARAPLGSIIGRSPLMVDVYKTIARVAPTKSTVLILGESGTGKELVARAVHQHSPRARRPFVAIDCGALPETLLESELFGHLRGAFTGAVADKKGLFEEADGNTCFLDEIGDISAAVQAKLLRVVQEGDVRRIGSQRWVHVDVRIVAATNKDLATLVRDGTFREDLYYRLNVVTIRLPPLRERVEDVPALALHFLRRHAAAVGKSIASIDDEAMRLLCVYRWPGNIRELENTIERAATLSNQRVLTADDLPTELRAAVASASAGAAPDGGPGGTNGTGAGVGGGAGAGAGDAIGSAGAGFDASGADAAGATGAGLSPGTSGAAGTPDAFAGAPTLEEVKRRYIRHVIASTRGNLSRAAAILDVDRRSLYRMLSRYKIDPPGREE